MALGWFGKRKKDPSRKALERARKLEDQGRWAEALSFYEEASADPELAGEASQGLRVCRERLVGANLDEARGYRNAGDAEKALEHARLALDLAGDDPELRARAEELLRGVETPEPPRPAPETPGPTLGATACACPAPREGGPPPQGDPEEAPGDLFEFYLEGMTETERGALASLGEAFREGFVRLQQGDLDGAEPLLRQAAGEHPGAPGVAYALGVLAVLREEWSQAEEHLGRALEADPDLEPAAHRLADVLREQGKREEARAFLEEWLAAHPDDAAGWLLLGVCRLELDDPEGTLEAADRAETHGREGQVDHWLLRARAYEALGKPDRAMEELQAVAVRQPDRLEALVPLGRLLVAKGGACAERGAEVFRHCARIDPERAWWHLLRVAEAYIARGWSPEAREILEQVRPGLPDEREALEDWERLRAAAG